MTMAVQAAGWLRQRAWLRCGPPTWSQTPPAPPIRIGLDTYLVAAYHLFANIQAYKRPSMKMNVRPSTFCCSVGLVALLTLCGGRGVNGQTPSSAQSAPASQPGQTRLTIDGDVEHPLSVSLNDLASLPRRTVRVKNEHSGQEEVYQGVLLAELLKRAGVPQDQQMRGEALTTCVRAQGADGYSVVFSLPELDSSIQDSDVLVADTINGQPLSDRLGPLRLVASHDKRAARWVRMLRSVTVIRVGGQ